MNRKIIPSPVTAAKASLSISILTFAMLAPVLLIAWVSKKIYRSGPKG